jgi:hypothetical protein
LCHFDPLPCVRQAETPGFPGRPVSLQASVARRRTILHESFVNHILCGIIGHVKHNFSRYAGEFSDSSGGRRGCQGSRMRGTTVGPLHRPCDGTGALPVGEGLSGGSHRSRRVSEGLMKAWFSELMGGIGRGECLVGGRGRGGHSCERSNPLAGATRTISRFPCAGSGSGAAGGPYDALPSDDLASEVLHDRGEEGRPYALA